jgi:putative glutamine amidotransferase
MAVRKPIIGVTHSVKGSTFSNILIRLALGHAGARMVSITADAPDPTHPIDGLMVTGGSDVFPERYGGELKPNYQYQMARDEMEAAWLTCAQEHDLPVLAICRGLQMSNVVRGGSLHFDVRTVAERNNYPGAGVWPSLTFRKMASIEPESRLASIVETTNLTINALHTQAVDRVGDGLEVTARDGDNVVQAMEDRARRFFLAVQFHPELLLHRAKHRAVFKALGRAAADRVASGADPVRASL